MLAIRICQREAVKCCLYVKGYVCIGENIHSTEYIGFGSLYNFRNVSLEDKGGLPQRK